MADPDPVSEKKSDADPGKKPGSETLVWTGENNLNSQDAALIVRVWHRRRGTQSGGNCSFPALTLCTVLVCRYKKVRITKKTTFSWCSSVLFFRDG